MRHLLSNCNKYLSRAEVSGHAETLDGNTESDCTCWKSCEAEAGSSCSSTTECKENNEQEKWEIEEKRFSRLIKTYTLAIMLLPYEVREKAWKCINSKKQEMWLGKCTARSAWEDVQKLVGHLKREDQLIHIFSDFLCQSDVNH